MRLRAPLVLCYHALSDSWLDALSVDPGTFGRQLSLLRRFVRPGTVEDVVAGRPVMHVTFDDAYRSILHGLPALQRTGIPATVFACADYGDGRPLGIAELPEARAGREDLVTLTWDELRALADAGTTVGSHTQSHAHLSRLSDAELDAELRASKSRIEDELRRECRYLAYPYGEEDDRVRGAAARAGYAAAFGLPGAGGPYSIPRVGIYRRDRVARFGVKAAAARALGRGFG